MQQGILSVINSDQIYKKAAKVYSVLEALPLKEE